MIKPQLFFTTQTWTNSTDITHNPPLLNQIWNHVQVWYDNRKPVTPLLTRLLGHCVVSNIRRSGKNFLKHGHVGNLHYRWNKLLVNNINQGSHFHYCYVFQEDHRQFYSSKFLTMWNHTAHKSAIHAWLGVYYFFFIFSDLTFYLFILYGSILLYGLLDAL